MKAQKRLDVRGILQQVVHSFILYDHRSVVGGGLNMYVVENSLKWAFSLLGFLAHMLFACAEW